MKVPLTAAPGAIMAMIVMLPLIVAMVRADLAKPITVIAVVPLLALVVAILRALLTALTVARQIQAQVPELHVAVANLYFYSLYSQYYSNEEVYDYIH